MKRNGLKIYEFRLSHQVMPQTVEAFSDKEARDEINRIYPYASFEQVKFKGYAPKQ